MAFTTSPVSLQFYRDKDYAEGMRDKYLVPGFYEKYANGGKYVFIDKSHCSMKVQKVLGADTVMQCPDGKSIFIEEKIVRYPGYVYRHFFLETHSVAPDGTRKPCWMEYAEADYLLYAFEVESGGLDVYYIPFQDLRTWFALNKHRYEERLSKQPNTYGRLVLIADVVQALRVKRYMIAENGVCQFLRAA